MILPTTTATPPPTTTTTVGANRSPTSTTTRAPSPPLSLLERLHAELSPSNSSNQPPPPRLVLFTPALSLVLLCLFFFMAGSFPQWGVSRWGNAAAADSPSSSFDACIASSYNVSSSSASSSSIPNFGPSTLTPWVFGEDSKVVKSNVKWCFGGDSPWTFDADYLSGKTKEKKKRMFFCSVREF